MIWTRNFIYICLGNFLLFSSFYMLLPILPLYLLEEIGLTGSQVGVILSIYTLAALSVRPVSAYWIDRLARKPLFLLFYSVFVACFGGYLFAATFPILLLVRFLHGAAFGSVTVSSNTVAVDIIPRDQRAKGIGYFSATTSAAMALGPMLSLFVLRASSDYSIVFYSILLMGVVGFLISLLVTVPKPPVKEPRPFRINNLMLWRAIPVALTVTFLSFGYGIITSYIAIYAQQEIGITGGAGFFFSFLAIGLIASRLLSSFVLGKGYDDGVIIGSILCIGIGILLIALFKTVELFYIGGIIVGFGYGLVTPAIQTKVVNLGTDHQRGLANATYLTFFDVGIGIGILSGGTITQWFNTTATLWVSLLLTLLCIFYFLSITRKNQENQLL